MNNINNWKEHMDKMKNDPIYKEEFAMKQKEATKDRFRNLTTFNNADDVPDIPANLTKEEYQEFVVQNLIKAGAIPKDNLLDGKWYYGEYRNSNFGKWNAEKKKFDHLRYKFGFMWDECNHFEDDDGFALFVPIREATKEEIDNEEKNASEIKPRNNAMWNKIYKEK